MINELGFIVNKKNRVIDKTFINESRALKPIDFYTDEELFAVPAGSAFIFDAEVYTNFFYIAFKNFDTGKIVAFEQSPDVKLEVDKLRWMLWRYLLIGFNIHGYDFPIIELALRGASCAELKSASDFIIVGQNKVFAFEKQFKIKVPKYNSVDLIEVAPLQGSLKLYAGRLHCPRMQDLPFDPTHILTQAEAAIVRPYGCNDLDNTELLARELAPELKLRGEMSKEYGVDLRSKSDAQIAEAVINSELQKVLGYYPKKPMVNENLTLQYNVPNFISFKTEVLNSVLNSVAQSVFKLDGLGSPMWPEGLGVKEKDSWVLKTTINKSVYKLGMGGLHSQEKKIAHFATENIIIADNDAESFYPRIILNQKLYPPHLGEAFLIVYEKIVNRRLQAKKDKNKKVSDSLKIVINGSFGKLGNKYSTLYAPQLMLQVTITGQLVLLMLIEMLELAGIEVVSGNTDGIVSKYDKSRHEEVRAIIAEWERITNFKTEETRYKALYSRDVNNYLALKLKNVNSSSASKELTEIEECKVKGVYSERGSALNSVLSKNPETLICSDAVQAYVQFGTPIEKTITECKDFRRFVSVKNVKGGGEKYGKYLGKVVRWYYAKNEAGYIAYVGSGNKVGKTDGAKPIMDLPLEFPTDINYEWYIKEAIDMLYDCGALKKLKTKSLFF